MSNNNCARTLTLVLDDYLPDNTAAVPSGIIPESLYFNVVRFEFGQKGLDVRVIPNRRPEYLYLSTNIFRKLNLYDDMGTLLKFDGKKLKFGPLVGVLMNEKAVRSLKENNPSEKIDRLAQAAHQSNVIIYFFTGDDIIISENSVNSVIYIPEKNTFIDRKMPLPDVLYDRGGGFTPQGLLRVRKMRKILNEIPELLKINSQHYFDKWDLHKKLSKHKETLYYLPDTKIYRDTSDLVEMLEKYKTIYLKKCTGSNGRSVMRVRKQSDSSYEYSYFKEKVIKGVTKSIEKLVDKAKELMSDGRFIIQEGIDVLTHKDNKVDMRVLVQRNGIGLWNITSIPVRIAVNDCAVTSTKSGSRVYQFDIAMKNILGFSDEETSMFKANIKSMIKAVINALEEEYGTFGELGIDIAIDRNKKLWFIESNAKPAKDTILIAGPDSDINDSFRLPFEYAKFLTGFSIKNR